MRIRWLLLLAVVAAAAFVAWRSFRTGSTSAIATPNGVASLERLRLGGLEQWILIRGEDASNPVLLWLHGGPGGAMMPIAHLLPRELERHFVVVHWDQRGAGKSYDPALPDEAFTLDHYVSDAIELSERLRERFGVERIFLLGHSWGAALGVLAAARRPDLFHAYIGMGQNVDNPREEEIGLRWVREQAEKRGDAEALRELEGLEPPYLENPKQILVQRKWLARYGGEVYGGVRTVPFFPDLDASLVWASLRSPEYSWRDLLGHQNGARRSRWAMHQEFKRLRLPDVVTRLDVPVWFLVGRHDYNTPFELVEEYYQELVAPRGKHLVWFEESAHTPALEEPERFVEVLVSEILPAVLPAR